MNGEDNNELPKRVLPPDPFAPPAPHAPNSFQGPRRQRQRPPVPAVVPRHLAVRQQPPPVAPAGAFEVDELRKELGAQRQKSETLAAQLRETVAELSDTRAELDQARAELEQLRAEIDQGAELGADEQPVLMPEGAAEDV